MRFLLGASYRNDILFGRSKKNVPVDFFVTPAIFCVCSCLNFAEKVFFSRNTLSICAATKSAGLFAVGGAAADAEAIGGETSADEAGFAGSFVGADSDLAEAEAAGVFLSVAAADADADGCGIAAEEDADGITVAAGASAEGRGADRATRSSR